MGHAAPGSDSRYNSIAIESNEKYLSTVRRHAKIIAGQFFGHLHADTFRVIYDKGTLKGKNEVVFKIRLEGPNFGVVV